MSRRKTFLVGEASSRASSGCETIATLVMRGGVDPVPALHIATPRSSLRTPAEIWRLEDEAHREEDEYVERQQQRRARAIEIEMLRGMRSDMALDHEEYMREWGDDDDW